MLFKLEESQYTSVRDLARDMSFHLAVGSVLSGKSPGDVITNDPAEPRAAFITAGNRHFLIGSAADRSFNEELGDYLRKRLFPTATESEYSIVPLYYSPSITENELKLLFGGWEPTIRIRQYFTIDPKRLPGEYPLPTGYSLHSVSKPLLRTPNLVNVDLLSEEIKSESPSVEHFLDNCFGVCAQYKNTLVGWCLSEYNVDRKCEVGIETLRPYQRQGLGSAMASALIREAETRGYNQVGWHSYKENMASTATARKVGFVTAAEYPICIFELPKSFQKLS